VKAYIRYRQLTMKTFLLIICLLFLLNYTKSEDTSSPGHILVSVFAARDRFNPLFSLAKELAKRGNEVVLTVDKESKKWAEADPELSSLTNLELLEGQFGTPFSTQDKEQLRTLKERRTNDTYFDFLWLTQVQKTFHEAIEKAYAKRSLPSLMVIDLYCYGCFDFAEIHNISYVVNHPQLLQGAGILTTQFVPSFLPVIGSVENYSVLSRALMQPFFRVVIYVFDKMFCIYLNPYRVSLLNLTIWHRSWDPIDNHVLLVNTAFGFEHPRSLPPNIEMVGPMLPSSSLAMPKSLENWFASIPESATVIYVSMGTAVAMKQHSAHFLLQGLSYLENTQVLWSIPEDQQHLLPSNSLRPSWLHVESFVPQIEVLKNPKVKLFISHCGIGSAQESLAFGIPLLCLPQSSDQMDVAIHVVDAKVGDMLVEFNPEQLHNKVELLLEESYATNARKIGEILNHAGGATKAAQIVENVRAIGYHHLIGKDISEPWHVGILSGAIFFATMIFLAINALFCLPCELMCIPLRMCGFCKKKPKKNKRKTE